MQINKVSTIFAGTDAEFKSIREALDYVGDMRKAGAGQPVTIKLTDKEYDFDEPIVIKPPVSDVTIEPADGKTLISGGRRITGFVRDNFNGADCFSAKIDDVANGKWVFTDLYVDGLRADFTRYPENGFFYAKDIEVHDGALSAGSKWFIADTADMAAIDKLDDCFVSFCHFWIDEHSPIESYDRESGKLTMEYRSRFTIAGEFNGKLISYYLENVKNSFKKPNQWYLDREKGIVYYIPRDNSQTPENITVYAPMSSQLFTVEGESDNKVQGIRFRNLKFAYTRGDYASAGSVAGTSEDERYASDGQAVSNAHGSLTFENAHSCTVENCEIHNFGVHAVNIKDGCDKIKISGNDIYDGGAGGVRMNGQSDPENEKSHTRNNIIENNRICHCGRRYMAACGVLSMNSYGNVISHNDISDLYYTGVSVGWVWGYGFSISRDNIIYKNHIHHLGQGALSDMGGVYLLGKQPGTIVSNNLIHDIKSATYGGWALYTDEGSSFITLENNVCYNASDNVYHQHYGSMNTVRNNIFAFGGEQMIKVSRYEEHLSIIFERNIIYSDGAPIYGLNESHVTESTVGASRNLVFDRKNESPVFTKGICGVEESDLQFMQSHNIDAGTVIADPKFANPDKFDFTLAPDSPAYTEIGFVPIDISDVGVCK